MQKIRSLPCWSVILLILAATHATADVSMQQRIEVSAGGVMSMLSSEGTVSTSISGDKSRSEAKMESKSSFLGSMGQNLNSTTITRLDQELIWQLRPDKQRYSEMTFEEMRAQIAESQAQLDDMRDGGSGGLPVSEDECQWSDSKFDMQETGQRQRFANVKAEQVIITVEETCTVPENDQTCVMTWTLENWMAKRMPGDDEVTAYKEAFMEKMGTEEMLSGTRAFSRGLLAMFDEGWEEAIEEAEALKGFPVKTVMQMEMGGENCTAGSGQPIAMDDIWSSALDASVDAATQTGAAHAGQKVGQETAEAMGDSVGGSVAGSAVGAASKEVFSGLMKKFGKKKKEPEPEPEATATGQTPVATAADSVMLFRITTELTDIDDDRIPAEQFEPPAGWTKVNPN